MAAYVVTYPLEGKRTAFLLGLTSSRAVDQKPVAEWTVELHDVCILAGVPARSEQWRSSSGHGYDDLVVS